MLQLAMVARAAGTAALALASLFALVWERHRTKVPQTPGALGTAVPASRFLETSTVLERWLGRAGSDAAFDAAAAAVDPLEGLHRLARYFELEERFFAGSRYERDPWAKELANRFRAALRAPALDSLQLAPGARDALVGSLVGLAPETGLEAWVERLHGLAPEVVARARARPAVDGAHREALAAAHARLAALNQYLYTEEGMRPRPERGAPA